MTPEHTRRRFLASVGAAGSVAVAGCIFDDGPDIEPVETPYDLSVDHDIENWEAYDPEWSPPDSSPADATFGTETVIENLEIPWDMSFADDGTLFFSERVGRISRYDAGEIETVTEPDEVIDHASSTAPEFQGQDWWAGGSEGGLLGIAVHPNYPGVPVLYAYYTYEVEPPSGDDDGVYNNRLVLYDLENDAEEYVVLDDVPGHRIIHNGARVSFGPRNYLWVTTGDAGKEEEHPQDTGSLAGKVLRLEPDGTPPDDNPGFEDTRIHTVGHRNPQSISWFPDGTAVAGEHGEQARDEVNVIEGGNNYGWPDARGGPGDEGSGSYTDFPEVTPPVVNTGPGETWAPPGGVVYTGGDVPALAGRFVLGGLLSQRLNVVSIYEGGAPEIGGTRFDADWMHPDYDAVAHTFLEDELGRIRHVEQGPNGELYAVTSNRDGRSSEPEENSFPTASDDRLVRIVQE